MASVGFTVSLSLFGHRHTFVRGLPGDRGTVRDLGGKLKLFSPRGDRSQDLYLEQHKETTERSVKL